MLLRNGKPVAGRSEKSTITPRKGEKGGISLVVDHAGTFGLCVGSG